MRFLGLVLSILLGAAPTAAAQAPQRVVSLNMCTDQLVLALADPAQIVGLSRFAGDPRLSHAADQSEGYPHLPAAAEAVIALEPDLVITGRFTNRATKDMLARLGYRVEEVPFVRSIDDARAAIAMVGGLLGQEQMADDLIASIDQAIESAASPSSLSALIIQRRGYATGTASLTGDLLDQLGIELASEELVGARGGFADLETIIRSDPDLLITANLDPQTQDQGTALLAHPALAQRFDDARRMALPERLTLCAGPSLIDAIHHIARERDAALERLAGE